MDFGSYVPPGGVAAPQPDEPAAAINIWDLIGGLLRRWKLICAVPMVLLLATFGILKVLSPSYQSTVNVLMLDPQLQGVISRVQQPDVTRKFDTVSVNTEIAIMRSATLLLRVVNDLRLEEIPEFQRQSRTAQLLELLGATRHAWLAALVQDVLGYKAAVPDTGPGVEQQRREAAVEILSLHIRVQPEPLSYVLTVSATSRDPQLAQRLASSLVNQYLAAEQEAQAKAFGQVALWLEGRLAELKAQIATTETAVEKLKSTSGLSDTGRGSVVQQQMADLNTQLMVVRADVAEKRARLEQARQLSASNSSLQDIPDAAASSLMSQLRAQQSAATRQLAQLRAKLGDSHSEVLALMTQLNGINKAINDEAAHALADLKNNFDIASRREQEIETNLERMTTAQGNSGDMVRLQQLQRVAEADRKLYDTYLAQYNDIETEKSLASATERVIAPAVVPIAPIFPRRSIFLLGAGGLGAFLGLGLALALNLFQGRAKLGVEAERAFGYPVVGNLPLIPRRGAQEKRDLGRALAQIAVNGPFSPVNEAIRTIRIGLRLSNLAHSPKVILVTSSLPGEGKSTLAVLLAASSAAAGQRAVLVDCDGRKSTVSRRLGKERPGLTELLSGTAELSAVNMYDPDIGCQVIPAGSLAQSPGDLLASRQMVELIERLRTHYDCIIVDSPPLLPVVDALVLATIADKILVTIDSSRKHDASILEALKLLRPQAHRVAGIVLNKLAPEQIQRYGVYDYLRSRQTVSAQ